MKSHNDDNDKEYFLNVDVQYPEHLHSLHHDLLFVSKRMKIKKIEKFVANFHDKKQYVIQIKN